MSMHPDQNEIVTRGIVRRDTLLAMLSAAMQYGELRFARQAALTWLTAFPGDIEVSLYQARAILSDNRSGQAAVGRVVPALDLICRKDPFSLEAYHLLAEACRQLDLPRIAFALTSSYVLDGRIPVKGRLEPWGLPLRHAWLALQDGQNPAAEKHVQEALSVDSDLLMGAAIQLLASRPMQDPLNILKLAESYHARWPDCLPVAMALAESHLKLGNEIEAVRLLHQCVAGDAAGQVAARLWGAGHAYRSLWPEEMVVPFDLPIPAAVAAWFGWNRLAANAAPGREEPSPAAVLPVEEEAPRPVVEPAVPPAAEDPAPTVIFAMPGSELVVEPAEEAPASAPVPEPQNSTPPAGAVQAAAAPVGPTPEPPAVQSPQPSTPVKTPGPARKPAASGSAPRKNGRAGSGKAAASAAAAAAATARGAAKEFEKLARSLKQPDLAGSDGRHPVCVVLTSREGLAAQYGPQTTAFLMAELLKLVGVLRRRPGWSALLYYPDDAACTAEFNLTPVNPRDPWKIKNALSDLDKALSKRGEMIGALIIVGGDSVVPFHRLPNPTDDGDAEIFSDSPYATLDANYFVPEWPVGRLPGENGTDAGLLIDQIRHMQRNHTRSRAASFIWNINFLATLRNWVERLMPGSVPPNFGYTAAVWRRSSLAVFRPIGLPHTVVASPPTHSGVIKPEKVSGSTLGYYNLHGLIDSPAWYGQRDPFEKSDVNDYPVALLPTDLHKNGHAPRVIFSEACYGGHVNDKFEDESLALKFLSVGARAIIASTAVAYGSLNTPLTAADLLGNLFWKRLRAGSPAGEALMQAKMDLVREMDRRQGYLDGEDQKTLISFVLYGDPFATYDSYRLHSKTPYRVKTHPHVRTISDRAGDNEDSPEMSGDVIRRVKQIVAEYLPGADLSNVHLLRQPLPPDAPPAPPNAKNGAGKGRMIVTVSKQVRVAQHVHNHYVRVTLDEGGKPIKMSISR